MTGVSEHAAVSPDAVVPGDCEIGPFTVIHPGVRIGAGARIGSHCVLGEPGPAQVAEPLVLGEGATVLSHSVLYAGSDFGPRLFVGHRATLREGLRAGVDLRVGTLCDLQGDSVIGDHVRMHSNVHCGQKSTLGSFVWIFPYVVLTNDPHPPSDGFHVGVTLEDFAVVATSSVVLPGVRVGRGAFVGAQTLVREDVPEDTICVGVPGRNQGPTSGIQLADGSGPAYPWRRHFHRGYPGDVTRGWAAEFE